MSDNIENAVQAYSLKLDNRRHEEIYARVDHTVNQYKSLRNIDKAYCSALEETFCN